MHHLNRSSGAGTKGESVTGTLNSAFQTCTDTSDAVELFTPQKLFLKPVARLNISVQLPQLKLPGNTISNWEVMEKLKSMVKPIQFTVLKVSKSTLEFIRFEGEIENKASLNGVVSQLDGRTIKLSGFSELLKIRAAEAKSAFPTRHTWDSYFRDAKNMNEMKPGERPDTIHLSNLPSRWFASKHDNARGSDKPSEYIFRKVFEQFGEVRCVDIPILDPYRSQMKAHISGLKTFSFGQELAFEGYVQFQEYVCFVKAMDALRGMKFLHKEGDKAYTASIKVDFDRTKHLSEASIRRRRTERERLMARERELEERERRDRELADKQAEDQRKQLEEEAQQKAKLAEERKQRKAERHQARQLRRLKREEAQKMNYKIAVEERKLLIAQRKLESIRLLDELFERVKAIRLRETAKTEHEDIQKNSNQGLNQKDEMEQKERELRSKLMKKFKNLQEVQLKGQQEKLRQTLEGKSKIKSVVTSSKIEKDLEVESDSSTSSTSSSDENPSERKTEKNLTDGKSNSKKELDTSGSWFNSTGISPIPGLPLMDFHPGFLGPNVPPLPFSFNPQSSDRFRQPHGDVYGNKTPWSRWLRQPRGRDEYSMMQDLYYGSSDEYYKYFSKLASSKSASRSRSRSRQRSPAKSRRRSRSGARSRSRSKTRKAAKKARSRSRNRNRTKSRTVSRSRSRSRSRSKKLSSRTRSRYSESISPSRLKQSGTSHKQSSRSSRSSSLNRVPKNGPGLKSSELEKERSNVQSGSKNLSLPQPPSIAVRPKKLDCVKNGTPTEKGSKDDGTSISISKKKKKTERHRKDKAKKKR